MPAQAVSKIIVTGAVVQCRKWTYQPVLPGGVVKSAIRSRLQTPILALSDPADYLPMDGIIRL